MVSMKLPKEVLVEIFLQLPSESLHECRQVCHEWNNIIMDGIWNSKKGRKRLQNRLERNWGKIYGELKIKISTSYINSGYENPKVVGASEDYLVVKKYPRESRSLSIVNIITKDVWEVSMEPSLIFTRSQVHINKSILAIWALDYDKVTYEFTTTVKVWCLRRRETLLEEIYPDEVNCSLEMDLDKSSSLPMVILFTDDKAEVLSFDNNNTISRYEMAYNVGVAYRRCNSNLVFPYLLNCFVNDNDNNDQGPISVWKIDDRNKQIVNHKFLPNFYNKSVIDDGVERRLVGNVMYVSSCFVLAICTRSDCIITVLNDDGDLIREVEINIFGNPRAYIKQEAYFFMYGKRLFISQDNESYKVYKMDLDELLRLDFDGRIPYVKFEELKQDLTKEHFYIISKTSIASATGDENEKNLVIKKMNFWPTN